MADTKSIKRSQVALIGAETLLGKEIQDVLRDRKNAVVREFAASGEGNFGESEGEAIFLEPWGPEAASKVDAIVVAGTAEGAVKAYETAKSAPRVPPVIDCTGFLESKPETRIVAPTAGEAAPDGWLFEIAQPAARALALSLQRLAGYRPIERVLAHVFEPASELGKRGVAELHQQTTNLLAFKQPPSELFGAQLSFNVLPAYGEEGAAKLGNVEQRIEKHVATILGAQSPSARIAMPSIRVLAAPVFHAYSLSLWVEFDGEAEAQSVSEALACAQIEVRGRNDELTHAVGAAGQPGLIAGDIRRDSNHSRAIWIWIAVDNLRFTADGAADLIESLQARAL